MATHSEDDVFALIGEEGFRKLIAAFYRQIPDDEILGPMYPAHDLSGAEARLCDFLIFRFGGPPRYLESRGHPQLRLRHRPFPIDQRARDRWIFLMDRAFLEADLPDQAVAVLRPFFGQVATFLINCPSSIG
ncbi:MAG: globin [Bryobacteraceae bacterium]